MRSSWRGHIEVRDMVLDIEVGTKTVAAGSVLLIGLAGAYPAWGMGVWRHILVGIPYLHSVVIRKVGEGYAEVPSPSTGGNVGDNVSGVNHSPGVGNQFVVLQRIPVVTSPRLTKTDQLDLKTHTQTS